ncbi:MAG: DUF2267 domain-containing protein [Chloroflexi bacterium]|nr:DUF2267 domain-containing protein [Chloroflexota bacterium]
MQYDDFIQKVQNYTGVSRDDAVKVTQATLDTICERVGFTHRYHLAHQLPKGLRELMTRQKDEARISLEEFYRRVALRADISYRDGVKYSQAVARVLADAVPQGELRDILAQLPDEYAELFGKEPSGPMSPSVVP